MTVRKMPPGRASGLPGSPHQSKSPDAAALKARKRAARGEIDDDAAARWLAKNKKKRPADRVRRLVPVADVGTFLKRGWVIERAIVRDSLMSKAESDLTDDEREAQSGRFRGG